MTAYIYLVNGKIHTVENCVDIARRALDESIVLYQNNGTTKHCHLTIRYPEKDIANISIQL